ncbi:Molybdopterin molybdenumtransferase [Burkholderia multivorans]|nr:Molybdopterin molybdenumtransferase [Burkholderia multivorans]
MITQPSPAPRAAPDSDLPLSLADAQALACRFATPVAASESVPLRDALHRVLARRRARTVRHSRDTIRRWTAMRSTAVRARVGAHGAMRVGAALAGHPFDGAVPAGACVRIMTGAPMPAGCDTVIPQERVHVDDDGIRFAAREIARGANCRKAGEDRTRCALAAGRILRATDIGLLASFGIAHVTVRRRCASRCFRPATNCASRRRTRTRGALRQQSHADCDARTVSRRFASSATIRPARSSIARRGRARCRRVITSGGVSSVAKRISRDVMARRRSHVREPRRPAGRSPSARSRAATAHRATRFFGLPGNPSPPRSPRAIVRGRC